MTKYVMILIKSLKCQHFTATNINPHTASKILNLKFSLTQSFNELCEEDLNMAEFDTAIKKMSSDRSPGPAGLTASFYKHFWGEIKSFPFQAMNECVIYTERMTTMKQGTIKLIPKPGQTLKRLYKIFIYLCYYFIYILHYFIQKLRFKLNRFEN